MKFPPENNGHQGGLEIMRTLPDGSPVQIVVDRDTERRLRHSSFRARRAGARAGNFRWWERTYQVLSGFGGTGFKSLTEHVLRIIEAAETEGAPLLKGTRVVQIEYPCPIGWAQSMPRAQLPETIRVVPWSNQNGKWSALQVDRKYNYLAPATRLATVVYTIQRVPRVGWRLRITNVYPGAPVKLRGDVTQRTGRVFFDLNHAGFPVEPAEIKKLYEDRERRARDRAAQQRQWPHNESQRA